MRISRAARRTATWIACFAVLLNALAPSVSGAVGAWRAQPLLWAEIGAASGFARLAAAEKHAPGHAPDSHDHSNPLAGTHCPFCLVHAGSFGFAANAPLAFTVFEHLEVTPPLSYRSPLLPFVRAAAQARAPPSLFS